MPGKIRDENDGGSQSSQSISELDRVQTCVLSGRKRKKSRSPRRSTETYTDHCPTLNFALERDFGASTADMPIMKETDLLENKDLKTGPYRPNSGMEAEEYPTLHDKEIIKAMFCTAAPYILGYTGFIPGRNDRHTYGMTFMKAVEVGGKEWHKTQVKLWEQDAIRAHALLTEQTNPTHLLSGARADNVDIEIDDGYGKDRRTYDYHVDPEKPPIFGYTGHIPGARLEVDHSKGYGESARIGFRGVQKERDERHTKEDIGLAPISCH
ncbi:uncharacterized protein [Temnothorax nylanderi]|uniref:uncharacterized protein n=1 Tax=Temnothorax nylanderi TaxID=102681 RepID=UPI003A89D5EE